MNPGVIFDCDGVIVDSEPLSCRASMAVLAEHGIHLTMDEMKAFIGRSNLQIVEEVNRRFGANLPLDLGVEWEERYRQLAADLQPMPGLRGVLTELKARGIPMAVASSGDLDKVRFSLGRVRLAGFFDALCSATEVAHGKPAPDLFLLAAARISVPPQFCLVVEDSIYGIMGAKKAGMTAAGFASSHPIEKLGEAGADFSFDHFDRFMAHVDRWMETLQGKCSHGDSM